MWPNIHFPPAGSTGSNMEGRELEGEEVRRMLREGKKIQRKLSKNVLVLSNQQTSVPSERPDRRRGGGASAAADLLLGKLHVNDPVASRKTHERDVFFSRPSKRFFPWSSFARLENVLSAHSNRDAVGW